MLRLPTAAALGLTALAVAAGPAAAAPTHTLDFTPAVDQAPAKITGATANGANFSFFLDGTATTGTCANADEQSRCETTLVRLTGPRVDDPANGVKFTEKNIKFRIDGFGPASDFDLRVYTSNAAGAPVAQVGGPESDAEATSPLGDLDPRRTSAGDFEETVVKPTTKADQFFLVMVPYFLVAEDKYDLTVSWTKDAATPS